MKIIDAFWERRNLGVDVTEVEFDINDDISVMNEFDKIKQTPYMVVKIPSNRNEIVTEISKRGFFYIENNIQLIHNLKEIPVKKSILSLCEKCSVEVMNKQEMEQLFDEIQRGMFETDRIYLDEHFSKEQAANRYINWINDLGKKNVYPKKIEYNNEIVGFFLSEYTSDAVAHGILGGVYNGYKQSGMGVLMELESLLEAKKNGIKLYKTAVSSNNLPVLQIMMSLGFQITEINTVFVKSS